MGRRQCSVCGYMRTWAPGTNSHEFSISPYLTQSQVCLDCLRSRARVGNNAEIDTDE